MSVNIYVRATKLSNVKGRIDYISNPGKQQEKLLATAGNFDVDFWMRLANESQAKFMPRVRKVHHKDGTVGERMDKCCEAREFCVDLPNSVIGWPKAEQDALLIKLSEHIKQITGTENAIGLHDSHKKKINQDKKGNAHVHVIVSERALLPEPVIKVADRNLFYDENGKRVYKKAEILDENKQLRPGCTIVPKGTVLSEEYFASKERYMQDREWLSELKENLADWINKEINPDQKRTVFDPYGPYLAQRHIGKYDDREEIGPINKNNEAWNYNVVSFNELVRDEIITTEEAMDYKTRIALSPNHNAELTAILSEIYLKKEPDLTKDEIDEYEQNLDDAMAIRRTEERILEEQKKKLRALYRQSSIAWRAVREAENSVERAMKRAEAKLVSAEIDKLKYELGYAASPGIYNRREAVREIAAKARTGHPERTEARHEAYADKSAAGKEVSLAYEHLKALRGWTEYDGFGGKIYHPGICRKANDPRIKKAEERLSDARWAYQEEKARVKTHKLAFEVEYGYKSLAMRLASDPSVPQDEVERATKRYEKAVELLKNPEAGVVKSLHHELKALQRSQRIREEKRRQQLENAKNQNKQTEISR